MYICTECKSDDVMGQAWISLNDHMNYLDWIEDEYYYCNNCKKHIEEIDEVEEVEGELYGIRINT